MDDDSGRGRKTSQPSEPADDAVTDSVVLIDASGQAIVFGPRDDLGRPLWLMGREEESGLTQLVDAALPAGWIGTAVLTGTQGARAIVFSPETMAALRQGHTFLRSGGQLLGTLTKGGKITHAVRFAPAGLAGGLVAAAPAMAMAFTVLYFQRQVAKTQQLVQDNIELTQEVLHQLRATKWHKARAYWDAIHQAYREATAVGTVTRDVWEHAQAQASETALRELRADLLEKVRRHGGHLSPDQSASSRRKYLRENYEAILRDIDGLLVSEDAWFAYQGLRAGYLANKPGNDPADTQLRDTIVNEALAARDHYLAQTLPVMDEVYRYTCLMAAVKKPGNTSKSSADAAKAVSDAMSRIAGAAGVPFPTKLPTIDVGARGVTKGDQRYVPHLLGYLVSPDETVLAVSRTRYWKDVGGFSPVSWIDRAVEQGYTMVTDRRLIIVHDDTFIGEGRVQRIVPLSAVRDTWITEEHGGMGGPDLVVKVRKESFTLQFCSACNRTYVEEVRRQILCHDPMQPGPTISELADELGTTRLELTARLAARGIAPVMGRLAIGDASQLKSVID